jgi:hypothetical protein
MAVSRTRGRDVDLPPPKSDAYTGLLAISFVAMVIGCVLLGIDRYSYPDSKPKLPDPPANLVRPAAGQPPAAVPSPAPAEAVPKAPGT